jgi:MDMPI C-terminal domain
MTFSLGPMSLGFNDMFGLRLNEHVFHTWDIAVMFDDAAGLPGDATALVVDNLSLIARFSGRPDGQDRTLAIRTTDPGRDVALVLSADGVELGPGEPVQAPELELPAEALSRLVYGRLDPDHTPAFTGDAALLDTLRAVFPGP